MVLGSFVIVCLFCFANDVNILKLTVRAQSFYRQVYG